MSETTHAQRPGDAPSQEDHDLDLDAEERRNVTHMIRWISGFIAWPALSISLAMMIDFDEHSLHILGLMPLGIAAVILFFLAPRIAARFVPPET